MQLQIGLPLRPWGRPALGRKIPPEGAGGSQSNSSTRQSMRWKFQRELERFFCFLWNQVSNPLGKVSFGAAPGRPGFPLGYSTLPRDPRPAAKRSRPWPPPSMLTCDVPELQAHHCLRVPVKHLEREIHADGGPVVRGEVLVHVALNDAGLAHAQVTDYQQLVQVLLVRGLHPGCPPALLCLACRAGKHSRGLGGRETRGARVQALGKGGSGAGAEGRNSTPSSWRNAQTSAQGLILLPIRSCADWRDSRGLESKGLCNRFNTCCRGYRYNALQFPKSFSRRWYWPWSCKGWVLLSMLVSEKTEYRKSYVNCRRW